MRDDAEMMHEEMIQREISFIISSLERQGEGDPCDRSTSEPNVSNELREEEKKEKENKTKNKESSIRPQV